MKLFRYITLFATALAMTACSSDGTLEDEKPVDDRQPMVFGTTSESAESTVTRTVTYLLDGFKVNTWKNFGNTSQQTVMDGYKVEYTSSASPKWHYDDVNTQVLRYWDLSAFPYEFRAVTPYSDNVTITSAGLTLTNTPFQAQTYVNGNYTGTSTEPLMVSHVTREKDGTDFKDTDVIKATEINDAAKANATRGVHLPFHHIISKIGFRIFINDPQTSSLNYTVTMKSIKISVTDGIGNFVTACEGYTATNAQGLQKGTFTTLTKATTEADTLLLSHGEYTGVNLREYINRNTAYDLCPNYIQQIPQSNVKLRVQLELLTKDEDNVETTFVYNQVLSLDGANTTGDNFTWDPDTRYIYYLHIPNLHSHLIYLNTCEILPWDEVQTSDIPIEL